MKKVIAALCALPLMFAACTQSETEPPTPSEQIGFATHVNKSSKATAEPLTTSNLTKFFVFGSYTTPQNQTTAVHIFNAEPVTKSGDKWTYSDANARYWVKGNRYVFHAYSCNNAAPDRSAPSFIASSSDCEFKRYTCNEDHNHDLIVATATAEGQETGNGTVNFDFKHVLTKVKVTFTTDFPAGYKVAVSNVKFINFYDVANLKVSTAAAPTWSDYGMTKEADANLSDPTFVDLPLTKTDDLTSTNKTVETKDVFFIPKNYGSEDKNVRITFVIAVKASDGTVIKTKNIRAAFEPTWLAGYAYNYNVKIAGSEAGFEQINFGVGSVGGGGTDGWQQGTDPVEFHFGEDVQGSN